MVNVLFCIQFAKRENPKNRCAGGTKKLNCRPVVSTMESKPCACLETYRTNSIKEEVHLYQPLLFWSDQHGNSTKRPSTADAGVCRQLQQAVLTVVPPSSSAAVEPSQRMQSAQVCVHDDEAHGAALPRSVPGTRHALQLSFSSNKLS